MGKSKRSYGVFYHKIFFYITGEQKAEFMQRCASVGLSQSEYMRRKIFPKDELPVAEKIPVVGRNVKKGIHMDEGTAEALSAYCKANGWTLGEGVRKLLLKNEK